jgi:hypothetical protein
MSYTSKAIRLIEKRKKQENVQGTYPFSFTCGCTGSAKVPDTKFKKLLDGLSPPCYADEDAKYSLDP